MAARRTALSAESAATHFPDHVQRAPFIPHLRCWLLPVVSALRILRFPKVNGVSRPAIALTSLILRVAFTIAFHCRLVARPARCAPVTWTRLSAIGDYAADAVDPARTDGVRRSAVAHTLRPAQFCPGVLLFHQETGALTRGRHRRGAYLHTDGREQKD